ncbi:MAG TPA: SusC/RagA family TonB-linked outer membrane protein [Gemmatimonas sp.]|nr:SusC/RagA family TonB-linked outer membrane protein [Gemmatimonas sp.]
MISFVPRALCAAVIACCALALPSSTIFAQARAGVVTGRIVEAVGGAPISNAQISVAGTTVGTLSNDDGRYTLRGVPAGAVTVRALRIGYAEASRQITVNVGETATVDLQLGKVAVSLTPVVTTATGTQDRLSVPNQIPQVDAAKAIENAQISSVGDLLVGKVAGVQILPGSGVNSASRIRIRGTSSISLSSDPIVFVDGIRIQSGTSALGAGPLTSRLNDINPEDIETIDVVRGPAASATYGTDAATGVLVITTKRGRAGATKWNVYTEQGLTRDANNYPDAYIAFGKFANTSAALNGTARDCQINTIAAGTCVVDSVRTFNLWQDDRATPLKLGDRNQYGISVSGGSESINYFAAIERETTTGTIGMPQFEKDRFARQGVPLQKEWVDPNNFRRVSLRSNLDLRISPTLQIPIRSYFLTSQQQQAPDGNNTVGLGSNAFGGPGTRNRLSGTDSLYGYRAFTPGDIFQRTTTSDVQRWIGSISPVWSPRSWLQARGNAGLDYSINSFEDICLRDQCVNNGQTRLGLLNIANTRSFQWTADYSATASFRPTSWLDSRTTAGFQFVHASSEADSANGTQLPPGGGTLSQLSVQRVGAAAAVTKTVGIFIEQTAQFGGRLDAVASVRGDQNSAFGQNFGTAFYPRLGLSYRMSEEEWFPLKDKINLFRLRSSWGQAGLRPGTTDALAFFAANVYRETAAEVPGLIYQTLGNRNLRPETQTEIEGGFDLGLFGDRVTTTLSYYDKTSSDAIINQTLAPSLGTGSTQRSVNIGSIRNWGWEYLVTAQPLRAAQFGLDFTVNGSYNSNEILDLGGQPAGTGVFRNNVGYPILSIWDFPYSYSDTNGDGLIALSEVTVDSVRRYMGYSSPRAELSIQSGVDLFKDGQLRFTALIDGKFGGLVENTTELFRCASRLNARERIDPTAPLDRQARCAAVQKPGAQSTSFGFLESGNYWRLRELAATWRIPTTWVSKVAKTKSGTVTLSARNLKLWSDYSGVDPETSRGGGTLGTAASNLQDEFQITPAIQTWTLRFNFGF